MKNIEARVAKLEAMLTPQVGNPYTDILSDGGMDPRDRPEESKPIDWSKVAACVPVKLWDDGANRDEWFTYPKLGRALVDAPYWDHASLITGIDIAWHGGDCPLPNGVVVEATRRNMSVLQTNDPRSLSWQAPVYCSPFDIVSFRVVSIHPDWTEEVV